MRTASVAPPETALPLDRVVLAVGRCCAKAPCLARHNDNDAEGSQEEELTSIAVISGFLNRP